MRIKSLILSVGKQASLFRSKPQNEEPEPVGINPARKMFCFPPVREEELDIKNLPSRLQKMIIEAEV